VVCFLHVAAPNAVCVFILPYKNELLNSVIIRYIIGQVSTLKYLVVKCIIIRVNR
jgi:hypothetical protein